MLVDSTATGSSARSSGGPELGPAAIASTTSMPSTTRPKMAYVRAASSAARAPSSRTMKNWLPWELGAWVRAMATMPRPYWPTTGSSTMLYPASPDPVPVGSPPWMTKPGTIRWNTVPS